MRSRHACSSDADVTEPSSPPRREARDGVAILRLTRPPLNALDLDSLQVVIAAIEAERAGSAPRAAVDVAQHGLRGAGVASRIPSERRLHDTDLVEAPDRAREPAPPGSSGSSATSTEHHQRSTRARVRTTISCSPSGPCASIQ